MVEVSAPVTLVIALILGHYLADFALQNSFVAQQKQFAGRTAMGFHALLAHCAHHGAVAALIAIFLGYNWPIALAGMFGTHLAIDLGKIRNLYGINWDQTLHMLAIVWLTAALLLEHHGGF